MNIKRMVLVAVGIALCGGATTQAQWIGATTGSGYVNGGNKDYLVVSNWTGGTAVQNSFTGTTLTGDLTLYLDNSFVTAGAVNFDYTGDFNLTLSREATTTRRMTLGGDFSYQPTGAAGRTLTFSNVPIALSNTGGVDRTFTIGTGHTMEQTGGAITQNSVDSGAIATLIKDGGGVFQMNAGGANRFNLQVDGGEFRFGNNNIFPVISGSRTLTINNSGTLNLQTFNNDASPTNINLNGGTIEGTTGSLTTTSSGLVSTGGGDVDFSGAGFLTLGGNVTYNSGAPNKTLTFDGGELRLGTSTRTFTVANGSQAIDVDVAATVAGTGVGVTKQGLGVMRLGGANSYSGATSVSAGVLLVDGSTASGSAVSVASEAVFGGNGTVNGNLTLSSGALFAFDPADTLTLGESSTFAVDSTFGVGSLRDRSGAAIDWGSIGVGSYTLITGGNLSPGFFDAMRISNFGPGNAFDIGGGRNAYFDNGSLTLVVAVPEPSTVLLGGIGLAVTGWAVRRLRTRMGCR